VTLQPSYGGSVTSSNDSINCPPICTASSSATSVTLHAAPAAGYGFVGWDGGSCLGTMDCTLSPPVPASITAYFTRTHNRIFVAAKYHDAAFGGRDGGDVWCNANAADAGLTGNFIAFLSSSGAPILDRIKNARGWVRMDGLPVADSPADLLAGHHWYVANLDEHGNWNPSPTFIGTLIDGGVAANLTCSNWTSNSGTSIGHAGVSSNEGTAWVDGQGNTCISLLSINCLEVDVNASLPKLTIPPGGRRAFVTQATMTGAASLAVADNLCLKEGGPNFLAMRSSQGQAALDRFSLDGGGWYRPDGTPLYPDPNSITALSRNTLAPIIVYADGGFIPDAIGWTWVGDLPFQMASSDCLGWTSGVAGDMGGMGSATDPDFTFSQGPFPCSALNHFVCFER
jgi:hypothetical protein